MDDLDTPAQCDVLQASGRYQRYVKLLITEAACWVVPIAQKPASLLEDLHNVADAEGRNTSQSGSMGGRGLEPRTLRV